MKTKALSKGTWKECRKKVWGEERCGGLGARGLGDGDAENWEKRLGGAMTGW